MNFAISYSGGKDSALSLYKMIIDNHKPVALVTTINIEQKRSWFHGVQKELLDAVADSLNIPLILCECTPNEYTEAYESGLIKARSMGASACVFGDIDIAEHKSWNEERCKNAGIDCILPLWNQNREFLVRETIEVGFKALIKIVQSDKLDDSFLGRDLSIPLIEKIRQTDSDVCGENGEYHTFVYDGPIFNHAIPFKAGEVIDFGTHKAIDILFDGAEVVQATV
ncbi:MAG: diphthine--ammonia ligase [Oscillospiraceae bacterium]|nr:diphthine--ammonia ligase [Oscillospiraceae bacterium]